MPLRQLDDPFVDAAAARSRNAGSQQSMRSTASTASARTRSQRPDTLLAPSRTRRPNGRSTPRIEDDIHEDPQPMSDGEHARTRSALRPGSPTDGRYGRSRARSQEAEFVNRQKNGSYLLGSGDDLLKKAYPYDMQQDDYRGTEGQTQQDADFAKYARDYFTSGAALGLRKYDDASWQRLAFPHKNQLDQALDSMALPLMNRLREQAIEKIETERWLYESVGRMPGIR